MRFTRTFRRSYIAALWRVRMLRAGCSGSENSAATLICGQPRYPSRVTRSPIHLSKAISSRIGLPAAASTTWSHCTQNSRSSRSRKAAIRSSLVWKWRYKLVFAALRAGIHYFDVAAEQRSARQSLATYHDEARHHGTVVLPAMAFYGGLADLLAAELTRRARPVECIEIAVALDYWHPTEGTRETGERNTARRLIVAEGRLAPVPRPAPVRDWAFPEPFGMQEVVAVPLSEIVTIHRHIAACHVRSFMTSAPLRDLADPRTPPPTASDPSGRSSQRFLMDVHVVSEGRRTRISAMGHDIYAITAPLVVEACARVLENPPAAGGAYAPAELFDSNEFLAALAPHLQIERSRTRWQLAGLR